MTPIKWIPLSLILLVACLFARYASAHGFELEQNNYDTPPTAFTVVSNQPYLDNVPAPPSNALPGTAAPTPAPAGWNIFTDEFSNIATVDTDGIGSGAASYGTYEGFVQQTGSGWTIQSATFNILSPLYYSDGTGATAHRAVTGTYLQFYDLIDAGGSDPSINPADYPNASTLPTASNGLYVNLYGTTPSATGFPVSAEYFHELEKDLYLGPGSTQTNGEYGYAFDVTVTLVPPSSLPGLPTTTLTSPAMVDVFAMTGGADFGDNAPQTRQDAASELIYDAATDAPAPVPEPSTFMMAALCLGACGMIVLRRRRASQLVTVPRS